MDKDKNALWERYEDAAFVILMHTVAEQEGEKALQLLDELEQDPSAQLPEEVKKRAEQTIRKTFAAQGRQSVKHISFRIFQRIAVAVLVVVLTVTCVFAAFPEVRANLYNLIIREYEDHTEFDYTEQFSDEYSSADFTIEPGWLPDGFTLSDEGETYTLIYKTYKENDSKDISITKNIMSGGSIAIDSENAKKTQMKIQGYEATLIEKEEWVCLVIPMPTDDKIIYLESNGVSSDDVEKIAENLPL